MAITSRLPSGRSTATQKFGKNAYLLWDKGVEYTTLLGKYFKDRFTELGGTIVLEDQYDDKATDFSAQIAKIKALPNSQTSTTSPRCPTTSARL